MRRRRVGGDRAWKGGSTSRKHTWFISQNQDRKHHRTSNFKAPDQLQRDQACWQKPTAPSWFLWPQGLWAQCELNLNCLSSSLAEDTPAPRGNPTANKGKDVSAGRKHCPIPCRNTVIELGTHGSKAARGQTREDRKLQEAGREAPSSWEAGEMPRA